MVDYVTPGTEPTLKELMEDPIVQLLMESDGVSLDMLLPLIAEVSGHMQMRAPIA